MREEKHYLDEEWNDLPLPDQEKAWQKMQQLLDKDDKRRPLLPVWFLRNGGVALLLIGILLLGRYLLTPDKNFIRAGNSAKQALQKTERSSLSETISESERAIASSKEQSINTTNSPTSSSVNVSSPNAITIKTSTKEVSSSRKTTKASSTKSNRRQSEKPSVELHENPSTTNDDVNKNSVSERTIKIEAVAPLLPLLQSPIHIKDSAVKRTSLLLAKAKRPDDKGSSSALVFSAGVGLQQAIAVNGQYTTDYTYHGTRNAIADLIPSVYFRFQKADWFVQAEFQYAVPQPVKQVMFSQKTSYSPANQNLNTEQFTIQKLYYHQLPFSINYYVLPGWSVGTGAMYSILAGAVTEQEVTSKNVQTGNESVSKSVAPIKGYKDSFLYKTTTGVMLQSDYQWKRFSVGLRFTQNLQPFIKYTAPNGEVLDEKNKALQAILRFRLF